MKELLDYTITFNFVISLLLIAQVFRHYLFFSKGKPSEIKVGVRRVFLADFLMALSVALFNITPHITGEFHNLLVIEWLLKSIQTLSIAYAFYANYKLYDVIKMVGDE